MNFRAPNKNLPRPKPKSTKSHKEENNNTPLAELLTQIGHPKWDVLLIGDGSGNGRNSPAGWSTVLIDKYTQKRKLFYGGMNCGSINFAESMPYIQAITWYDAEIGKDKLAKLGFINVHIITDSETVTNWGEAAMTPTGKIPRKNIALWASIRELKKLGYRFFFHWFPRKTTKANELSDSIAAITRKELMSTDPRYIAGPTQAGRAKNIMRNLENIVEDILKDDTLSKVHP